MWQIYPCRTAISQILIPILTAAYLADQVWQIYPHRTAISQILIPILTAHIWPTRCGRSNPLPIEWKFHRFWFLFWQLIFGWPGVADLTPPHWMTISQILIPILTVHICLTRCGRSNPVEQQFHRFWFLFWQVWHIWLTRCGRSTPCRTAISQILIPILTAHILADQVWQIYPCRTAISQILIPILTAHIWLDQVWQMYPTP